MNTAKKINSLLSSGAVSVTGPGQPRILKQRIPGTPTTVQTGPNKCYICDEPSGQNGVPLAEARTSVTSTDLPTKIGTVVGEGFWVIHIGGDMVCKRCVSMFNHMDRLEHDLDRVKTNILALINNKYGIDIAVDTKPAAQPPPAKLQRLNTGLAISRKNGGDEDDAPVTVTRKLTTISNVQTINRDANVAENQLANIFDSPPAEKPNNAMAQIRQHTTITQVQQSGGTTPTVAAASPTVTKKVGTPQNPTKIYKCMSCDFKTMDLKQFQPHYETCKQQSAGYRCKICRKLFTNMNALKTHTAEKHSNDYVCSICSVNYVNESAFKRHMETNHPDVKTIENSVQPASTVGMQSKY